MPMHGKNDHELKIGSVTDQFTLARDQSGNATYTVSEDIPQYQNPLLFTQQSWLGGHGQDVSSAISRDSYYEGQSIDTTQPGKVFLGPLITEVYESDDSELDSAPVGFFWAEGAGKWLCFTAGKIYIYGTKWTAATTTLAGVKQIAEMDNVLYAALGTGTKYYYSTDGSTWTITDLADGYADGFIVAPSITGITENLWKFKTPNELSRTTNGKNLASSGVAWESPTYVGETTNNIIGLFLNADRLYVGKEDSLYWLDSSGGTHNELPGELKVNHSTDNFKYIANWQTSTYFSLLRGMGEMTTAGTYRPMGPVADTDDIGKTGDVVGITSDKDWVYVAEDEGTNTIIYKGRENYLNGALRWEWCPWVFIGTNAISTIRTAQHSTTDRRLWFGYGTHTAYVVISANPLADSAARYCASGFIRMSYTYGSNPIFDKMWQSAVIEATRVNSGSRGAASSGETVEIKYRDDEDTSATSVIAAATTAGIYESNLSTAITDKKVQFEIHLASDTNTATPVVSFFQVKGVEKPTTIRVHEATYLIGDSPSDRVKTLKTFFDGGRTSTSLIKFADLRLGQKTSGPTVGDYVWCVMQPGYPKFIEMVHEKGRQPEMAVQVKLQEVSFTIS
jgi:hypothetical protein